MHGIAKARLGTEKGGLLLKAIGKATVTRGLDAFNPQELSNAVRAFATAHVHDGSLFEEVTDELVRWELHGFTLQNISHITVGVRANKLYSTVADKAVRLKLRSFNQ